MHEVLSFYFRCDKFPSPWYSRITDSRCHHERYPLEHGDIERFCKVDCDRDGYCTETIRTKKCSCEGSINEHCLTIKYKVYLHTLNLEYIL